MLFKALHTPSPPQHKKKTKNPNIIKKKKKKVQIMDTHLKHLLKNISSTEDFVSTSYWTHWC